MSSTFTSRLKLERQASGANSGNWGNLVNYVLNRIDSSVRGYIAVNVAGSANVTLVSNNSTGNTDDSATDDQVHNKVIEFTGALGANINVFTDAAEGEYVLFNNTTGSYSLTFGNAGHAANGVVINQGTKSIIYTTGTAMTDIMSDLGDVKATSLTSNGDVTITGDVALTGNLELKTQKAVVFEDSSGGQFAALKAAATTTSYTLTLPSATGSADQVIKTDGSGNLSFTDIEAGISWNTGSIKTANVTISANEGLFCNTSGGAFTVQLPAGSAGTAIAVADYTRTFGTNNLLIKANGSEKIGGVASNDAVLSNNGQAATFIYVDATEGWINIQNATDTQTGQVPFITASGGNATVDVGDYRTHVFTSPGTLVVNNGAPSPSGNPNEINYLVVAGGGGARTSYAGGAGAGGFRISNSGPGGIPAPTMSPLVTTTALSASAGSFSVAVGAGGPGGPGPSGANGVDSTFSTITSSGGGFGGSNGAGDTGGSGGSGGGGRSGGNGNTPPVSPNQGFGGGNSPPGINAQGGGGGAASAGTTGGPPNGTAGPGGSGSYIADAFIGPTAPSYGTPGPVSSTRYFAGGGTGGRDSGGAATGGIGGGGPSANGPTSNGTVNTGGGAGGAPSGSGTGGSGIVMLRYKFQ